MKVWCLRVGHLTLVLGALVVAYCCAAVGLEYQRESSGAAILAWGVAGIFFSKGVEELLLSRRLWSRSSRSRRPKEG